MNKIEKSLSLCSSYCSWEGVRYLLVGQMSLVGSHHCPSFYSNCAHICLPFGLWSFWGGGCVLSVLVSLRPGAVSMDRLSKTLKRRNLPLLITFAHEEERQLLVVCAHPNCRKMRILASNVTASRSSWWEYVVRVVCSRVIQGGSRGHTDDYLASETPSFLLQSLLPAPHPCPTQQEYWCPVGNVEKCTILKIG